MPAIDDYNSSSVGSFNQLSSGQQFTLKNFFWTWYYNHLDDTIVTLFLFVKVRVRHLHPLFVLLFGAPK